MSHFIARPITAAVVEDARARHAAGDPAVDLITVETPLSSPCRRCLRDGEPGEQMFLFPHSPFAQVGPYAETGPIFAHAHNCAPPQLGVDELPEVTRVRARVVLRAYDAAGAIHHSTLVDTSDAGAALRAYFDNTLVAFVHARAVTNGCFSYAVARAP